MRRDHQRGKRIVAEDRRRVLSSQSSRRLGIRSRDQLGNTPPLEKSKKTVLTKNTGDDKSPRVKPTTTPRNGTLARANATAVIFVDVLGSFSLTAIPSTTRVVAELTSRRCWFSGAQRDS